MNLLEYNEGPAFSQKHLLRLQDYSKHEILQVLSLALRLKKMRQEGKIYRPLEGKTLAMIFTKSSTRTRVSFESGMFQLGGHALFLSSNDIQLGRGESIADTAKVLSRMVDGIMIRTFAQSDIDDLAKYGSIPVINGLSDLLHPCQALADIMTIYEHKHTLNGLKLCYLGDGNNVANSLLIICSKLGIDIAIGCPKGYLPNSDITASAYGNAAASGSEIIITQDANAAIKDADAVYTDVWSSMGQAAPDEKKAALFLPYQVNEKLFSLAKPDAIFLHCLPAHRGEEVTAGVIDGPQSVVFDEAENRLHAQKAVMALLIGGLYEA
ncbi:MAG: ornithine carbamoyltransferase [Christensenellales bacterium]|jgi:ornithine carbamoyltransferase